LSYFLDIKVGTIQGCLGHIPKKICSQHSRRNMDDKC